MAKIVSFTSSLQNFHQFLIDMRTIKDLLSEAKDSLDNTETSSFLLNSIIFHHPDLTEFFYVFQFDVIEGKDNICIIYR